MAPYISDGVQTENVSVTKSWERVPLYGISQHKFAERNALISKDINFFMALN